MSHSPRHLLIIFAEICLINLQNMNKKILSGLSLAIVVMIAIMTTSCQPNSNDGQNITTVQKDSVDSKNIKPSVTGYADVNGMKMYYEVSGEGDPIIVLHGGYMNIPSMGEIIPKLAKTHKVYALEFQGHGRTNDIDRPITYPNLAEDVAAFMDVTGLKKADVFGYSVGAEVGLQLAIRHPEKVNRLIAAAAAYDLKGWQPEFKAAIPQMTVEMIVKMPFAEDYRKLSPNPDGFPALVEKMIALEKQPMAWEDDVKKIKTPVLIIAGDADVATLEHTTSMFRLLGGGVMGDMGKPLPNSRLAIMPATSHTAVITQVDLLLAFIEPFLKGEIPKGLFELKQ
jgi:pimeloyl-ACP methyl ester carboxylesterase